MALRDYAMFCLNNPWDQKLFFVYRKGKDGERVIMAARALRRCVVELGKLGKTDMIDQALTIAERLEILRAWADPRHVPYPKIFVDRQPVPPSLLKDWTEEGVHYVGERINEQLRL